MDNLGIVYDINEKYVVIFTPEGRFLLVKRRMDMALGQQVNFGDDDIYVTENEPTENTLLNSSFKRFISIDKTKKISLIAAAILLVFLSIRFFMFKSQPVSDNFAYIDVDINPSIEFSIDSSSTVINVKALNNDAKKFVSSLKLKGLGFYESFGILYDKCRSSGIFNEYDNGIILVSGSLNISYDDHTSNRENSEKKLSDTLISVKDQIEKVKGSNVHVKLIKVSPTIRQEALKNNISMGRYKIYLESYKNGVQMSIGQAADESVNVLLNTVELLDDIDNSNTGDFTQKTANSNPISTPTKSPFNTSTGSISNSLATPYVNVSASFSYPQATHGINTEPVPTKPKPVQTPVRSHVPTSIQTRVTPQVPTSTSISKRNNIVSGKMYKIINKLSSKCVEVYVWSLDDGGRLSQWTYVPTRANQHWIITEVDGGYYKIINQNSNKAMDVKASSTDLGAMIQQSTYTGADSQLWSIIDTGDGFCKIVNKNSKKCLDVCDFSKCDGANIIQWDFRETNNDNQKFWITAIN